MDLSVFNPWWRDGRVPPSLVGNRRRALADVLRYLDIRQMVILSGVRRAGKTTLLFQVVDELLRNHNTGPYQILYFSFDELIENPMEIIQAYEKDVLKKRLTDAGPVYLFLDEIQKLGGWPEKVKILYDLYPDLKIFLSGSAAVDITRGTRESLAGRFFDMRVEPLDFDEYLEFTGAEIDQEREVVFELEIRQSMARYMETGGFIEALDFGADALRKYFAEGLLQRVVFRDLPGVFAVRSPDLLHRLAGIVAERPGIYLDYASLGGDLGHDRRTIADYFAYLEQGLLLTRLYNYAPSRLTSEKKMKRAYLSSTAFTLAMAAPGGGPAQSLVLEQFFVNHFRARFFWRTPEKDEVDLVHVAGQKAIPVEVKIRREIKRSDAAPLVKFMRRFGVGRGLIISDGVEASWSSAEGTVEIIPYWKYWSLRETLARWEKG